MEPGRRWVTSGENQGLLACPSIIRIGSKSLTLCRCGLWDDCSKDTCGHRSLPLARPQGLVSPPRKQIVVLVESLKWCCVCSWQLPVGRYARMKLSCYLSAIQYI